MLQEFRLEARVSGALGTNGVSQSLMVSAFLRFSSACVWTQGAHQMLSAHTEKVLVWIGKDVELAAFLFLSILKAKKPVFVKTWPSSTIIESNLSALELPYNNRSPYPGEYCRRIQPARLRL